ncbi:MAG: hypothetical protein AAF372_05590, partial [Pseudomonadota bacterium]
FLYRLMLGYLYSGQAPDGETMLDLLPVDYAAKAIIYLAIKDKQQHGSCYHLIHPNPVSSNLLFDCCLNAGIELQRVSYQEWFLSLKKIASSDSDHPLFPLVALFASRDASNQEETELDLSRSPYDVTSSQDLLNDAPFELPALDEKLFSTYIASLNVKRPLAFGADNHTAENNTSHSVVTL